MQDLVTEFINRAYTLFDQLGISLEGLLIAAVVFLFALVFAVREALTWFLRIDDVKRDLKRIRESLNEVEGELRALQTILARKTEEPAKEFNTEFATEFVTEFISEGTSTPAAEPAPTKTPSFPVVH